MKKIICFICLFLFGILFTILLIAKTKNWTELVKYYTIPRIYAYRYEKEKEMTFEIFVNDENSLIEYVEENKYFIKDKCNTFSLEEVRINKQLDYQTKEEFFYKYEVITNMIDLGENDIHLKSCRLEIENKSFSINLELGELFIYRKPYDLLKFTDLYGNYAYIDNELYLVGITIQLPNQYRILYEVKVGDANCLFEKIEKDIVYDSQRNLSELGYNPISNPIEHTSYELNGKYGYYYFPITYQKIKLITEVSILFYIDGNIYYIDDFLFLANNISLKDYSSIKVEGRINYA